MGIHICLQVRSAKVNDPDLLIAGLYQGVKFGKQVAVEDIVIDQYRINP
jgi:hypothetical protein